MDDLHVIENVHVELGTIPTSDNAVTQKTPAVLSKKPFMSMYGKKFQTFIEGLCVSAHITEVEHWFCCLTDTIYTIELTHGEFHWELKRTYDDIYRLHNVLYSRRDSKPPKSNRKKLEFYLERILKDRSIRDKQETMMFFEISPFSFVDGLGIKRKEGEVEMSIRTLCCGPSNENRWLFIKDSFIAFTDHTERFIDDVILMNKDFKLLSGYWKTKKFNGLVATNLSRKMEMTCPTGTKPWIDAITHAFETSGFQKENRHKSFAPVREDTHANWFIDGASYMDAVADALDQAKEEIFISDWWLSPEVNLKRPPTGSESEWRLDLLLERKATEGVKIYVLLFHELPRFLKLNSKHSKNALCEKHDNIKVMRHNALNNLKRFQKLKWSHHDKFVVIDQTTAFLGGIDLCFGRWDTTRHRLADLLHHDKVQPDSILDHKDPGAIRSYQEACVRNLGGVGVVENLQDSTSAQMEKKGKHLMKELLKKALDEISPILDTVDRDEENAQPNSSSSVVSAYGPMIVYSSEYQIWVGKDYANYLKKDFDCLDHPFQDDIDIDRTKVPRMPWHDIGAVVYGKAARDVARHFIERWNFTKTLPLNVAVACPLLLPKSYSGVELPSGVMLESFRCDVQILRSSSEWSVGLPRDQKECSILNAYLDLIKHARHYIYIENQFFISLINHHGVHNGIAKALYERIKRAKKNGETFRVYVVMPLLPGFNGEIETKNGKTLQIITNWTYHSICRGKHSLMAKLEAKGINPSEYITFHGLRTHEKIQDEMCTEFIYVHAKMMIVDDLKVIIGSANLNDRSMQGDRDSEIAVLVEDTQRCKTIMNGTYFEGGHYVSSLRKQLFREHLGIGFEDSSVDLSDPVCEHFYKNVWIKQATMNTEIYHKVFKCIPNNECKTFDQTAHCREESLKTEQVTEEDLQQVKGHLVLFPLEFLKDEKLHHIEDYVEIVGNIYT